MKELIDFISKDRCPCCNRELSFYMKLYFNNLFEINREYIDPEKYIITFSPVFNRENDKSHMIMYSDSFKLSKGIYDANKNKSMFLFGVCNEHSIEKIDSSLHDFEINVHDVCYYKSTKFLSFNDTENGLFFKIDENEHGTEAVDDIIAFEAFSFALDTDTEHKSYMMRIDNLLKKTSVWHYTCSQEDLENEDYDPKIFHKDIDAVKRTINFSDKKKIINMLENWILMS